MHSSNSGLYNVIDWLISERERGETGERDFDLLFRLIPYSSQYALGANPRPPSKYRCTFLVVRVLCRDSNQPRLPRPLAALAALISLTHTCVHMSTPAQYMLAPIILSELLSDGSVKNQKRKFLFHLHVFFACCSSFCHRVLIFLLPEEFLLIMFLIKQVCSQQISPPSV